MKKISVIISFVILLGGGKSFAQSGVMVPIDTLKPMPFAYQKMFLQPVYQPADKFEVYPNNINYPILIGMGSALTGVVYSITNYYANTWWRDQSTEFHFQNDWEYALWLDKFGHMYSTYVISHFFSAGFEAANLHPETAMWLSLIGGLGIQLYVEVNDGFGPNWGFSPGDALFDLLGGVYTIGQYYVPYSKNFQMRVSYWPSQALLNGKKPDHNFSDDYEGQKLWLAFRMKKLLPDKIANYWPSFLMLSVGMAVKDFDHPRTKHAEYYIALDLDAEEIPLYGGVWQFLKNTLNFVHLPMPGVRISPNAAFFALVY